MAANPSVVTIDTVLYCPMEPEGRMFPAGSPWPGDVWSVRQGGPPATEASNTQAMKDLIAAQDQIEAQAAQISNLTASLDERSGERDAMAAKVDGLEQRAAEAEKAQAEAADAAKDYMTERDAARGEVQRLTDLNATLQAAADKVPRLVAELEAANQALADAKSAAAAAPKPSKAKADPASDATAA